WDQEPDERQPQLARVRHRPIVDEHVGGVGAADNLEQIAQLDRVARPEAGASSSARAKSGTSSGGNTRVIENGRASCPNSASRRSGSSAASSSLVGCSGSSAYGQKRSSGRYRGGSAAMEVMT